MLHLNHSSGESGIFRSPKLAGDVATGEGAVGSLIAYEFVRGGAGVSDATSRVPERARNLLSNVCQLLVEALQTETCLDSDTGATQPAEPGRLSEHRKLYAACASHGPSRMVG